MRQTSYIVSCASGNQESRSMIGVASCFGAYTRRSDETNRQLIAVFWSLPPILEIMVGLVRDIASVSDRFPYNSGLLDLPASQS